LDPTHSGHSVVVNMLSGSHSANVHPGPETRAIGYGSAQVLVPEYGRGTTEAPPPTRLLKFHAPEIVFGIDSMVEAAHAALRLGALRPLLVTDPGLIEAGWVAELVGHLKAQAVDARVWAASLRTPRTTRSPRVTSTTASTAATC
jgi:hypothetical protein